MKAITVVGDGSGALTMTEIPEPELGPQDVLISVRAASVNRADLAVRSGTHQVSRAQGPTVMGLDAAGVVASVGAEVTTVRPGDRVMAMAPGGLAERVVVPAEMAVPIPHSWDYHHGAGAIVGLMTGHNALCSAGRFRPGESVLIHGAASGVGLQAVQLAKHLTAATIITTTRSDRNHVLLRELGADHTLTVTSGSFAGAVTRITSGKGVDVIIDHVGGPYLADNIASLAFGGRLVDVGRLGGAEGHLDLEALAFKRTEIIGVTFRTRSRQECIDVVTRMADELGPPLAKGELCPIIDAVLSWRDIDKAHERLRSNRHTGKLVLTVD